MRHFIFCLLISCAVVSPVCAAQPVGKTKTTKISVEKAVEKDAEKLSETNPDALPVLQQIKGSNKELAYDYLGQRFGIDAWLLSGPSVMQIIYTSNSGSGAMVGGALVGPDGKEVSSALTKEFMTQYPERAQEILTTVRKQSSTDKNTKPVADNNSPSEILWQKLQQGGKVSFGSKPDAPVLYAMLDPAQPATKDVWAHLEPLTKNGKITLNILPLGLTTADSIMEIASVLGDPDPKAAWSKLMQGQSAVTKETPDSSGILGMKANVDLAQGLHLRTLPFMVYRDGTGKIRIIQGVPKDWNSLTKELSNLK